jgi:hypothetical protein
MEVGKTGRLDRERDVVHQTANDGITVEIGALLGIARMGYRVVPRRASGRRSRLAPSGHGAGAAARRT